MVFLGALGLAGTDFLLARATEVSETPSLTVMLDMEDDSPLSAADPVRLTIATRVESKDDLLVCVSAIYEFPAGLAADFDPAQPGVLPFVTIAGPQVSQYGNAPLSNAPLGFDPGFMWRPQIDLDAIDWDPIPPGYPEDVMSLSLPTFYAYEPELDMPDEDALGFAYSGGCYIVEALPTKQEGAFKARYTFRWGDRESQPVVDKALERTAAEWLFMATSSDVISSIEPEATGSRSGERVVEFSYDEPYQVDVVVGATRLQALTDASYWVAGITGSLVIGYVFRRVFEQRRRGHPS